MDDFGKHLAFSFGAVVGLFLCLATVPLATTTTPWVVLATYTIGWGLFNRTIYKLTAELFA